MHMLQQLVENPMDYEDADCVPNAELLDDLPVQETARRAAAKDQPEDPIQDPESLTQFVTSNTTGKYTIIILATVVNV